MFFLVIDSFLNKILSAISAPTIWRMFLHEPLFVKSFTGSQKNLVAQNFNDSAGLKLRLYLRVRLMYVTEFPEHLSLYRIRKKWELQFGHFSAFFELKS